MNHTKPYSKKWLTKKASKSKLRTIATELNQRVVRREAKVDQLKAKLRDLNRALIVITDGQYEHPGEVTEAVALILQQAGMDILARPTAEEIATDVKPV